MAKSAKVPTLVAGVTALLTFGGLIVTAVFTYGAEKSFAKLSATPGWAVLICTVLLLFCAALAFFAYRIGVDRTTDQYAEQNDDAIAAKDRIIDANKAEHSAAVRVKDADHIDRLREAVTDAARDSAKAIKALEKKHADALVAQQQSINTEHANELEKIRAKSVIDTANEVLKEGTRVARAQINEAKADAVKLALAAAKETYDREYAAQTRQYDDQISSLKVQLERASQSVNTLNASLLASTKAAHDASVEYWTPARSLFAFVTTAAPHDYQARAVPKSDGTVRLYMVFVLCNVSRYTISVRDIEIKWTALTFSGEHEILDRITLAPHEVQRVVIEIKSRTKERLIKNSISHFDVYFNKITAIVETGAGKATVGLFTTSVPVPIIWSEHDD